MINFSGILVANIQINLIINFQEKNRLYIIHFFNSSFLCSRKESCFWLFWIVLGRLFFGRA